MKANCKTVGEEAVQCYLFLSVLLKRRKVVVGGLISANMTAGRERGPVDTFFWLVRGRDSLIRTPRDNEYEH